MRIPRFSPQALVLQERPWLIWILGGVFALLGLGLLPLITKFTPDKITQQRTVTIQAPETHPISGYEIYQGVCCPTIPTRLICHVVFSLIISEGSSLFTDLLD